MSGMLQLKMIDYEMLFTHTPTPIYTPASSAHNAYTTINIFFIVRLVKAILVLILFYSSLTTTTTLLILLAINTLTILLLQFLSKLLFYSY